MTNKLEIIIIELEKLEEYINETGENRNLLNWCKFIKTPEKVGNSIMEENKNIRRAKEELDKINQDEKERKLAELREKAILDELAIRKSGFNEGIEEGIKKEKIEIAKSMLKENLSIDLISKITGLDKEEVEQIN